MSFVSGSSNVRPVPFDVLLHPKHFKVVQGHVTANLLTDIRPGRCQLKFLKFLKFKNFSVLKWKFPVPRPVIFRYSLMGNFVYSRLSNVVTDDLEWPWVSFDLFGVCWLSIVYYVSPTLCSEKKHPLTFSFISPWIICGFKQKLQWIYPRIDRFWKCKN